MENQEGQSLELSVQASLDLFTLLPGSPPPLEHVRACLPPAPSTSARGSVWLHLESEQACWTCTSMSHSKMLLLVNGALRVSGASQSSEPPTGALLLCKRETKAGRGKLMAQCQQMCWQPTNSDVNPPLFPPLNERGQFLAGGGTTPGWGDEPARISLRPQDRELGGGLDPCLGAH